MKRREKFGDYLMDISKYIVTGFVLTAFFDEFGYIDYSFGNVCGIHCVPYILAYEKRKGMV